MRRLAGEPRGAARLPRPRRRRPLPRPVGAANADCGAGLFALHALARRADFPDPDAQGEFPPFHAGVLEAGLGCRRTTPASTCSRAAAPATPQERQEKLAFALKVARCLRAHGFPNFPDPTASSRAEPQRHRDRSELAAVPGGGDDLREAGAEGARPAMSSASASRDRRHGRAGPAGGGMRRLAGESRGAARLDHDHDERRPTPRQHRRRRAERSPSPAACARTGCRTTPTPTSSGLVKESLQQLGVSSSRFQAAQSACRHLLPNGGSAPTAAQVQQVRAQALQLLPVRARPRRPELPRPRAATAAYPTLPPLESIRARRSSRPRTRPAGSTGRPTCPRMPPTTPTPGRTADECHAPNWSLGPLSLERGADLERRLEEGRGRIESFDAFRRERSLPVRIRKPGTPCFRMHAAKLAIASACSAC